MLWPYKPSRSFLAPIIPQHLVCDCYGPIGQAGHSFASTLARSSNASFLLVHPSSSLPSLPIDAILPALPVWTLPIFESELGSILLGRLLIISTCTDIVLTSFQRSTDLSKGMSYSPVSAPPQSYPAPRMLRLCLPLRASALQPDPSEPSCIVTAAFSRTRDMAKAISQYFMDARHTQNAAGRASNLFKDRSVNMPTYPLGLAPSSALSARMASAPPVHSVSLPCNLFV